MVTDFGRDLSCTDDLDPTMREVVGFELMREAVHRRLRTRRGLLIDDPNYGIDALDYVNGEMTAVELASIPAQIEGEIRKDERIAECTITQTSTAAGGVALNVLCETAAGPFSLTIPVTQVINAGAI